MSFDEIFDLTELEKCIFIFVIIYTPHKKKTLFFFPVVLLLLRENGGSWGGSFCFLFYPLHPPKKQFFYSKQKTEKCTNEFSRIATASRYRGVYHNPPHRLYLFVKISAFETSLKTSPPQKKKLLRQKVKLLLVPWHRIKKKKNPSQLRVYIDRYTRREYHAIFPLFFFFGVFPTIFGVGMAPFNSWDPF